MTDSCSPDQSAGPGATLQKLGDALEAGNLRQAHRMKTGFLKFARNSYPREVREKFHSLDVRLKELQDWQQYASNAKRLELCEKMEHLKIHHEIHPEEKARAIQELQKLWRQLGPSDSNEGQKHWKRFKLAGDLAFTVCAEYFDTRRDRREQNLQQRNEICDSLSHFLLENDWQDPDWKSVRQIAKAARSEWKRFEDIPHASRKEMHRKFFQTLAQIEDKLKKEQERNHQLKQECIQQVKILIDADENMSTKVREIKNIQNVWKDIGVTDRGIDQKLWLEFRKHCDAVFALRDEEKHQREQIQAAEVEKAEGLCVQLESLLADDSLETATIQGLYQNFTLLAMAGKHPLQRRFARLQERVRKQIKEGEKRQEDNVFYEFKRKVELCEQLETDADPQTIMAQWQGAAKLPEELELLVNKRYQCAQSGICHYAVAEEADEICVRVEMLAHINSPDSSQGVRLRLQVERLDQQLSKGIKENRSKFEQLRALQVQWYSMGPVQHNAGELKTRFDQAVKVITSHGN